MSADQKCRQCGCTNERSCAVDNAPCQWVAPDLCSACLKKMIPAEEYARVEALLELQEVEIPMAMDGARAFQLLAALQLVCRHPDFPPNTRVFVEGFARYIQERISISPIVEKLCEEGWHAEFDVPVVREPEPARSGLILPPGYENRDE